MTQKTTKIFAIGPNKCGTNSLNDFFEANDIPSMHWDEGALARRIISNASAGLDPLLGYQEYQGFTDIFHIASDIYVSPVLIVRLLRESYPDAIYILNTRDFDKWALSRDKHRKHTKREGVSERIQTALAGTYDTRTEFDAYHKVKENPPARFHIFDLESPTNFEDLARFFETQGFAVSHREPMHANKTPSPADAGLMTRLKRMVKG